VQGNPDCVAALSLLAVVCAAAIKDGTLQLIWDEATAGVANYKVFRVDNGGHALMGTATERYFLVKKPSEGYQNLCFAVEALVGTTASADSPAYCYAPGATASTRSFNPSHTSTQVDWSAPTLSKCIGVPNGAFFFQTSDNAFGEQFTTFFPFLRGEGPLSGSSAVGGVFTGREEAVYAVTTATGGGIGASFACHTPQAIVKVDARAAGAAYDLHDLANHKVYSATLTLRSSQTVRFDSNRFTLYTGGWCPIIVGAATREWWIAPVGNLTSSATGRLPIATPPAAPLDVTSLVASWSSFTNSYGFIVENAEASSAAIHSDGCVMKLDDPVLQVVYF
jgi:hypothetical protein